jgi:hypothetical protein
MRKNPRRILSYPRVENKALTAIATNRYELRQLAACKVVAPDSVAPGRTSSGMLVGTKLGTMLLLFSLFLCSILRSVIS